MAVRWNMGEKAKRTDTILFSVLMATAGVLILAAVISQPNRMLLEGFLRIQGDETGLITDSIVTGGQGGALLNAGIILALSTLLIRRLKMPFTGMSLACLFMMAGFALMGKNLVNTLPILAGGWIYSLYRQEPFSKYLYVSFFGTCLSPMVSFVMNNARYGLRGLTMVLCGVAIGFFLPPVSAYTVRIHQGYNLYNVGFAAGFIGLGMASILKGFGVEFADTSSWSQDNGMLLDVLIWGLLAALFALGIALGCRRWQQYRSILRHSGRAVADFTALDGLGPTFVNMALTGALGLLYLRWMGVDLNGPMLCCIFSLVGFAAFGKHPRNVIPVALGAVASSRLMGNIPIDTPAVLVATYLCTGLAPIAGQFGVFWGFLAGFMHMTIVQHTAFLHGGMNLYNNGFAAGLTCVLMLPIIQALRPEPEE